jgi:hypothetical protein
VTGITIEPLGKSLARLPDVIRSIPDIIRDPSANPLQAAILLGIGITLVLIVLVSVVLFLVRRSPEEEELLMAAEQGTPVASADMGVAAEAGAEPEPETRERAMSWITVASIVILAVVGVWAVAGVTTSTSDVCASCHASTIHGTIGAAGDPHGHVSCVSCHEGGGAVARATVNVLTRAQHVVLAQIDSSRTAGYGIPVSSDRCAACHRKQIEGTTEVKSRGVRVSHKEPLDAGAQCVDCHVLLKTGVIGAQTVGMAPCLRCHDGETAKVECSTCHVGDPAGAIASAETTEAMATVQVPNPQCDGCHTNMTTCDACHGIRMPHSIAFMMYGHAREAAIDIWNGQRGQNLVCAKCHYPGHNYCVRPGCHIATFPQHPSPAWREAHAHSTWSGSARTCACHDWNEFDHNGMNFCQICHAVKPAGALP